MIKIGKIVERIHIQNTTFQKEFGEVVKYTRTKVIVRLFYKPGYDGWAEDTSFTRAFSKKTGRAVGQDLKILP